MSAFPSPAEVSPGDAPTDAAARLEQACGRMGLDLSAAQRACLLEYLAQLQRWNRTYNLTAIRDPGQMLVQHLFDSLAVVGPLERALRGKTDVRVLDVGSGGGLPGVVLAIACPAWRIRCVDAVEKKAAFVRQAAAVLALPRLQAVHARVESLPPADCDVVVSRAFASLADFAELAGRHADNDGTLVAMKGREPLEEIAALPQQGPWRVERVEPLTVPELDARRCLVWMRRKGTV